MCWQENSTKRKFSKKIKEKRVANPKKARNEQIFTKRRPICLQQYIETAKVP